MSEVQNWGLTANDNNNPAPDGWPENTMAVNQINDAGRELQAAVARWHADTNGTLVSTGTGGAYAVTAKRSIPAYFDGLELVFEANHASNGAATLAVNGLLAKSITQPLVAGIKDGIRIGQKVHVVFDSTADAFQLLSPDDGILARWFNDTNGSLAATGAANAFAVTSNRNITALLDNTVLAFTANHTISGAATLNLNALGARAIKRFNGSDLASGDIVSGQPVMVLYKSAANVWFMLTSPAALTGNTFADFSENIAPGNPAVDNARLYAKDESGRTILAYRDNAGFETRILPGTVVDRAYAEYTGFSDISALIPFDDTQPQNSEGVEILAASLVLKKATNRVRARFMGYYRGSDNMEGAVASLFIDGNANALRTTVGGPTVFEPGVSMGFDSLHFEFEHSPGATNVTYRVRAGVKSGIITFNSQGTSNTRGFGGSAAATLVLEEIWV